MGHVEFCVVLEEWRGTRQQSDSDDAAIDDDGDVEHSADGDIVYRRTNRRVAVKVHYADNIDRYRDRRAENPMNETAALQMLGPDPVHVVGADEVLLDGRNIYVIMRFCDGGDFFEMMQAVRDRHDHPVDMPGLSEGEARFWFRQLIRGVVFLHSKGICHHDLSPENVMIDGQEALIIDLGMCLRVPYQHPQNNGRVIDVQGSHGVTPRCLIRPQGPYGKAPYMSPEIYSNRHAFDGAAVDVWSAGVIFFCMITGNQSYLRPHRSDLLFIWMTQRLRQLLNSWNVKISETGIQLLEGMLQPNPRLRLTLEKVNQHAWFDEPDDPPDQA
jgi:serine/threonine protein kinase